LDGKAFTGEGGFFDAQVDGFEQAQVGGDKIAGFEEDDIAGDEVAAGDGDAVAVTQHVGFGGG